MRKSRLDGQTLQINVCGKVVKETESERILGMIANNKLTWWHHLYGDNSDPSKPIPGLISQLSKRVGLLSRLVKFLPKDRFKMLVNGIFMSKLLFCLEIFGNCWSDILDGSNERNNSFTKTNLLSLQVLLNKVLRLQLGQGYDTPVSQLLADSNTLSVNQLVAYTTIKTVFKIKQSGEPCYLADRLMPRVNQQVTTRNKQTISLDFKLGRAREGFLYRGKMLYNALPDSIKSESKWPIFKKIAKEWIQGNIPPVTK